MDDYNQFLEGKTILIVDDEPLIREMLNLDLTDCGAKIEEAGNSIEALKLIENINFDLIISDVRMPGGSGIDLLSGIEKLNIKIKTIMISGFSDLTDEKAINFGAHALVTKPFKREDLLDTIIQVLS